MVLEIRLRVLVGFPEAVITRLFGKVNVSGNGEVAAFRPLADRGRVDEVQVSFEPVEQLLNIRVTPASHELLA